MRKSRHHEERVMNRKLILSGVVATLLLGSGCARADEAWDLYRQLKAGNCGPAMRTLQDRAAEGAVEFQFVLGSSYRTEVCGKSDSVLAMKWLRRAAEQGHDIAQFFLGDMFRLGLGVPKDMRLAAGWYMKAAEQG